jgi:hypothetical protein
VPDIYEFLEAEDCKYAIRLCEVALEGNPPQ